MAQQFYFAWIDEDEDFDPSPGPTGHAREDEDVFSFVFDHSEGDFAAIQITIKNPRIGLLATGRKTWCFFSFNAGTDVSPNVVPIIKGRLVGIPTNVFDTIVTLEFIARPSDFAEQKAALANTLKVLPYWDPIFVSPDNWDDPDAVLEAYSALWHIDPVTHEVTISDILVPDNTITVTEDEHFYDELSVTLNESPLRACQVIATIPWKQDAEGGLSLTKPILDAFGSQVITSFTMKGLQDDWPKPGSGFANGWDVVSGSLTDISYSKAKIVIPDIFTWQGSVPNLPVGSIAFPLKVTGEYHSGEKAGFNFQYELVVAALGYAVPELSVAYTAGRDFGQIVSFTLVTDQQDIVTLPDDGEFLSVKINANPVSDLTEDDTVPIGDKRARDYVHTPRGIQSIEHLLLIARAHLIARSRAVETAFGTSFQKAMVLRSLRDAALLTDHRLPGGEAIGKIKNVKMALDGDSGAASGEITIASCVGKGGSHTASAGTPSIWDEGYIDPGYQEYTDAVVLTDTADIAYTIPPFAVFDDKLDFVKGLNATNAIKLLTVSNTEDTQRGIINAAGDGPNTDQAKISEVLKNNPTQITVQMVPMEGGPFKQEVVISVSDLVIPQQINLEAPSNA